MKHRNWFWGIFFVAAAVFVIASQVGAFKIIGFWSIIAAVLLAAVFIDSLIDLNYFGVFVSAALLYLIFQHPYHLVFIPFWQLMFAAILASAGFSILFHGHHHICKSHWNISKHGVSVEKIDGNTIYAKSNFSESCRYLKADSLKKAELVSNFGKLSVYFDQVQLDPQGAEVFVDVNFGEMVLYLSKDWRVINHAEAGIGSVSGDAVNNPADPNAPTLTINGKVSFARLEIHYI